MLSVIVGWSYISVGTVGILANILVTYLFLSDKTMRQNITYIFMTNLAIADTIVLSSIAFYAGIKSLVVINLEYLDRFMAWVVAVGWYPGCIFFSVIAFTRWVAIARPEKLNTYFSKKILTMCIIIPWTVCSLFYLCFIFYPETLFIWFPNYFSWGFDEDSSFFGYYLQKQNTSTNILFAGVEFYFNLKTLIFIRNTRQLIRSLHETKNRSREIKLFAQCFITGCVFTSAAVMYAVFYAVQKYANSEHFLMMHAAWVCHHLINPFIYFSLNSKLREVFLQKFFKCIGKKFIPNISTLNVSAVGERKDNRWISKNRT